VSVIGLLSWYDENPAWLAECVASAAKLCDHLIAVDGPYALFPDSTLKPASGPEQTETIQRTASGAGMGCTIHVPRQAWWGDQVEKRDFMFQLGATVADPGEDWYLIVDADEVVAEVPADTRARLEATTCDVAEVMLWERNVHDRINELVDASPDYRHPLRRLYRAQPDMHVVQAHYVITAGDKILSGAEHLHKLEPAEWLTDVVLEHRPHQRPWYRQDQKHRYYDARERSGAEAVSRIDAAD
jgi:hypothetical protein